MAIGILFFRLLKKIKIRTPYFPLSRSVLGHHTLPKKEFDQF
jgi:hypothetical protein